jgi:hypothetical protein
MQTHTHTIKTTLTFSPSFLQRVKTIAHKRKWSMSRVIENDLNTFHENREQQELDKMYATLRKWQGSSSADITDASQTIDETLYGENGVWRGQRDG